MISTVLCGRFYKIFVSPMLHEGKEFSWSQSDRLFSFDGGDRARSGNVIKRKQP